jgi:two-component system catabolic regulation response regulator CreB
MNKILLVEDQPKIAEGIIYELEKSGLEVKHCSRGDAALEYFNNNKVDLVLLDIGLPDTTGYAVLKRIRENSEVPVIIETDYTEDIDEELGIDLGADDYIRKPFSLKVLTIKIKRRLGNKSITGNVNIFEVNHDEFDVIFEGNPLGLTDREFNIFERLNDYSNQWCLKEDILQYLEDCRISKNPEAKRRIFETLDSDTKENQKQNLNTHIKNIRNKIDPDSKHDRNKYIDSKTNKGYKLNT